MGSPDERELRQDFRAFRLDRMRDLEVLAGTFTPEPGRTLQDFLADVAGAGSEERPV